jgi:hypothetical protein
MVVSVSLTDGQRGRKMTALQQQQQQQQQQQLMPTVAWQTSSSRVAGKRAGAKNNLF